jgi:hypothetical protein
LGGQVNLRQVQSKAHTAALDARAIARVVMLDVFTKAWNRSSEADQIAVMDMIRRLDKHAIDLWVEKQNKDDDEEKTVRELRITAKAMGIEYYNRMNRLELLAKIQEKKRA